MNPVKQPNSPDFEVDKVLDAQGLECPLPILKTKKQLAGMNPGEVLHVLATDKASPIDFQALCLHKKYELVHMIKSEELFEFFIRKVDLQQS